MAVTAKLEAEARWVRELHGPETLADDLGILGAWVGPRTGPDKRTQGQKEDYVLRRLLVAWKETDRLRFPVEVRAETDRPGEPDFLLAWPDGQTLGVEVTEAGEENYQAWMTHSEADLKAGNALDVPLEASTRRTIEEIRRAIAAKVEKFQNGFYRSPSACDLVVYDNTAWGGFLDNNELVSGLGRPHEPSSCFRQVHLVFGDTVFLDLLGGERRKVDVSKTYEIDYAKWITEQVTRLRQGRTEKLDLAHIAEELESLGRSERRALAAHLRNLMLHLLKWRFRPERRSDSWLASIDNARSEIHELLTEMPSLRRDLKTLVSVEFVRARREAARETQMSLEQFPKDCPHGPEQLIDPEFLPGDELGRE